MARGSTRTSLMFAGAALIIIGWATLRPMPESQYLPPTCIICGAFGGVDFVLNIALFVPLGVSLLPVLKGWRRVLVTGFVVTLLIEALQLALVTGRDASLGDVLANSLGTAVGCWLAHRAPAWWNTTGAAADSAARLSAVAAAAVVALSAWLLEPVAPTEPLWVQWALPRPGLDPFRGRLETVTLNTAPLQPGVPLSPAVLVDPGSQTTVLHAVISGAPGPTRRPAMVIRLASPHQEGLFVGQWGDAAVFRVQTRSARARLRSPTVRLDGAFASLQQADDSRSIRLSASASRSRLTLQRQAPESGLVESSLSLTPGLGWTLLLPWTVALGSNWWPVTVAWMGMLSLPAAYFAARSATDGRHQRPHQLAWGPLALTGTTMVLAPLASGTSQAGLADWSGFVAGILVGLALGRLTSRGRA